MTSREKMKALRTGDCFVTKDGRKHIASGDAYKNPYFKLWCVNDAEGNCCFETDFKTEENSLYYLIQVIHKQSNEIEENICEILAKSANERQLVDVLTEIKQNAEALWNLTKEDEINENVNTEDFVEEPINQLHIYINSGNSVERIDIYIVNDAGAKQFI